jgi:hypothetical protein
LLLCSIAEVPSSGKKVPFSQSVHEDEPSKAEYFPPGQMTQSAFKSSCLEASVPSSCKNRPISQGKHLVRIEFATVPAGHTLQSLDES